ncbi:MAG: helix-turn-helix domain-containing protein [Flavobacteriales bacterium]
MKTAYRNWIAKRLIELRNSKNLTQKEHAKKLEIKIKAYQAYEEGRAQPSVLLLVRIAKLHSMSLAALLEGAPSDDK